MRQLTAPESPAEEKAMKMKLLPIGSKTHLGVVVGMLWISERYYLISNEQGDIVLIPAVQVET